MDASVPLRAFGENLAWFGGTEGTAEQVVQMWESEERFYNEDGLATCMTASGSRTCGHFTQVVWKGTASIGCAKATCDNTAVWSCNYDPPGNVVGRPPF